MCNMINQSGRTAGQLVGQPGQQRGAQHGRAGAQRVQHHLAVQRRVRARRAAPRLHARHRRRADPRLAVAERCTQTINSTIPDNAPIYIHSSIRLLLMF